MSEFLPFGLGYREHTSFIQREVGGVRISPTDLRRHSAEPKTKLLYFTAEPHCNLRDLSFNADTTTNGSSLSPSLSI